LFREVFELFNDAIARPLQCGLELVVDESLISCRGRFPFKQYMPLKPGKYGFLYKVSKQNARAVIYISLRLFEQYLLQLFLYILPFSV